MTPDKDFQWDEKTSKEWAEYFFNERVKWASLQYGKEEPVPIDLVLEQFKSSRLSNVGVYWEIVSYGYAQQSHNDGPDIQYIHSVRRLFDGEVFSLNDKQGNLTITNFIIKDGKMYAHFAPAADRDLPLSDLKKPEKVVPQPLFCTNDGKANFAGDDYWKVWDNFTYTKYQSSIGADYNFSYIRTTFSTEEKAKNFVLMNKPVLSVNECLSFLKTNFLRLQDGLPVNEHWFEVDKLKELAKSKINQ